MKMQRTLGKGGITMNKEEILQRSRNEKRDEGMEYQVSQNCRRGSGMFMLAVLMLLLLNIAMMRLTDIILILTIEWIYLTGYLYGNLKPDHRTLKLGACILITVVCLITYLTRIF